MQTDKKDKGPRQTSNAQGKEGGNGQKHKTTAREQENKPSLTKKMTKPDKRQTLVLGLLNRSILRNPRPKMIAASST